MDRGNPITINHRVVLFVKYYYNDKITADEIGEAGSTQGTEKCIKVSGGKP